MSEITLGMRDVVALIVGLGGPLTVYVGMRDKMTAMSEQIKTLVDLVKELREDRRSHTDDIAELRETQVAHHQRIKALEERPATGNFAALAAETTGQHKAVR